MFINEIEELGSNSRLVLLEVWRVVLDLDQIHVCYELIIIPTISKIVIQIIYELTFADLSVPPFCSAAQRAI